MLTGRKGCKVFVEGKLVLKSEEGAMRVSWGAPSAGGYYDGIVGGSARRDYEHDYRDIAGDFVGYRCSGPGCVPLRRPISIFV